MNKFLKDIENNLGVNQPIIIHTDAGTILKENPEYFCENPDITIDNIINSIIETFGQDRLLFFPCFDYKYTESRLLDLNNIDCQLGPITKRILQTKKYFHNKVPVFGHISTSLNLKNNFHPGEDYSYKKAFGEKSFYDWFKNSNGVIIFWGCDINSANTFIHQIEIDNNIKYRFAKNFKGSILNQDLTKEELDFKYFVRPNKNLVNYEQLGGLFLETEDKLHKVTKNLNWINASSAHQCISSYLQKDPYALLTQESRINLSNSFFNGEFEKFSSIKKNLLIISDLNLEFLKFKKNLNLNKEVIYSQNLFLGFSDFNLKEKEADILFIIPSIDSMGLNSLENFSINSDDLRKKSNKWLNDLNEVLNLVQNKYNFPKIVITSFICSTNWQLLGDSNYENLLINHELSKLELEIHKKFFTSGINFLKLPRILSNENSDEYISSINFRRFRCPLTDEGMLILNDIITNYSKELSVISQPIKAISVDLDNTLWNGIAGDEGASISKDYPNNTSIALQSLLIQLKNQGLFLTINSKNNIDTIKKAFNDLQDKMLLSFQDFSDVQANWEAKSQNIINSAKFLNISPESFLHIDDSEFECNQIKASLPEVMTIQFSNNDFDTKFLDLFLNKRIRKDVLTKSDKLRSKNNEAKIISLINDSNKTQDLNTKKYIKSLNATISIQSDPEKVDLQRVEQLFKRTNQFNNAHNRYSLLEIRNFVSKKIIYTLDYKDNINTASETAAVIIINKKERFISDFLMSCRFFSRGLEFVFLQFIIKLDSSSTKIDSIFINRNDKNKVFQDFIDKFIISNDSNKIAELKNINSLKNYSNEYKSLYKEVKF